MLSKEKMKIKLIGLETIPSTFFQIMQEILKEEGHISNYLHLELRKSSDFKEISKQLMEFCEGSDLIGISCMTNTYPFFVKISRYLKKLKIPIIVGGIHPTVKPIECLEHADYVCVGEGEEVIPELINRIQDNKRTDNIKNVWLKKDGKIIKNKLRPIIKDLNKLPVPKFNLKRLFYYHKGKIKNLEENKYLISSYFTKYYLTMSSRGCPYQCSYCLNHCLIKIDPNFAKIRRRDKEHLISELENVKKILPRETIIGFVDDDFCAKPFEELKEICEEYKKRIDMPFICASTPTSINDDKIKVLIQSGLTRLEIGVQTISEEVNKNIYRRYVSKKQMFKTVKLLEKYRYKVMICYDFILDNPWEKDDTKIESLKFLLSIKKPINVFLFSLTLYPGTNLYELAKKEGIIYDDYSQVYKKNHVLLENNIINTLFILYVNYNVPKIIIKFLIKNRDFIIFKKVLGSCTYSILRIHNYYKGLKDSLQRGDKELRNYYLFAPIKYFLKKLQR
jgi:radical SAM superfamily enzyme YgiQ (UPF0313 family)